MKQWRLHKKIYLPGWMIRIDIVDVPGSDGEWVVGENGGGIIRLRPGLTKGQQKYTFSHELLHAAVDYNNAMLIEGWRR